MVYAAAAAGKKHGVSLRLPQRRSPRSSTDLGKTPSSRGKINLFFLHTYPHMGDREPRASRGLQRCVYSLFGLVYVSLIL